MLDKLFENKEKINVVYFGGSITQGAVASNHNNSYAGLTAAWLKEKFGHNKVNYINKAVGGTSSVYGLLRLQRDVIANKPDLLFVEFAVNDSGFDSSKYVESIIRTLNCLEELPYVIFLYTTNNEYSTSIENFKRIAEHYNIPQINLKNALKEHLCHKDPIECGYFADSVHPFDKGHKFYADKIIECLSKEEYYKKPTLTKEPLNSETFELTAEFISSQNASLNGKWEKGINCEPVIGETEYLVATKKDSSLEITFEGNIFAIEHGLHKNGGKYKIFIDDDFLTECNSFYKDFESNQLVLAYSNFELENKKHSVKIITSQDDKQVLIYNLIIGRKIES